MRMQLASVCLVSLLFVAGLSSTAAQISCPATIQGTTLTVTCMATGVTPASYTCQFDAMPVESCTPPLTVDLNEYSQGEHTLEIRITLTDGSVTVATVTFTGTMPGDSSFDCNGQISASTLTFECTTVNLENAAFTCSFDGMTPSACDPNMLEVDLNQFSPDEHTIEISTTTPSGQTLSQRFTFSGTQGVTTPPPPMFQCSRTSTDTAVTIDCTSNVQITSTECSIDGRQRLPCTLPFVIQYNLLDPGQHNLSIFINSTGGAVTTIVPFTVPTGPPFQVSCQVTLSSTTLTLRSCPANREIVSTQCRINNGGVMNCATPYNLDISGFDPGNYVLVVTATSADGEEASFNVNFTVSQPVPPLGANCSIAQNETHIVINCQANRTLASSECSFDGGAFQSCSFPLEISIAESTAGSHTVAIQLTDQDGQTVMTTIPYEIPAAVQCSGSFSIANGDYQATYVVLGDSVRFSVSARTSGWVGIGVSNDGLMPNTDVIAGAVDDSGFFVDDRFATVRAQPPVDSSQDITDTAASFQNGFTAINFTRPRNSGDSNDISLDQCRFLLYAYGPLAMDNSILYHGNNRGTLSESFCLPSATDCPAPTTPPTGTTPPPASIQCSLNTEATQATISCTSTVDITSTECSIDGGDRQPCTLPFTIDFSPLDPGQHTVSLFFNTSGGAATTTIPFTVREEAFTVTCQITVSPTTLTVRSCFGNRELASTQCSINNGALMDCATPYELDISTFDPGNYTIAVTATAVDGATATTPETVFTVEPPPPPPLGANCTINQNGTHIIINCEANRTLASSQCSFDGGPFQDCSFPVEISIAELTAGSHTVAIQLTDEDGQVFMTPATYQIEATIIGFTEADYTVPEDGGTVSVSVSVLSGSLARDVVVTLQTVDGTATALGDYTPVSRDLTFNAATSTQSVEISISDDIVLEDSEFFSVSLSQMSVDASVTLDPANVIVNIEDDDTAIIGFTRVDGTEEGDSAAVSVSVLSGSLARDVVVTLQTVDGTATAPGDYTPVSRDLTFNATTSTQTVEISVSDDIVLEGTEYFNVSLSQMSVDASVTLNPAIATVIIEDVTTAIIGFTEADYAVTEDGGTAGVSVSLSGSLAIDVVVTLQTVDGTATAPGDYTPVSRDLTFNAATSTQTVEISISDDLVPEESEFFSVSLSLTPVDATVLLDLDPANAIVNIEDDDLNVTVTPPTSPPTSSPSPLPPVGLDCIQALDTFVTSISCRTITELVSIMCSFDGVPAPNCTLGVTINFLDFSPGPHNYTLNVVDVNGQTDQFVYEFTGQVAPRIQLNLGRNVSSALEGSELLVLVDKQGLSFGDVTVRIVPLTYDQFEARGFDLDNIFPTRPAPASVDDITTAVNNNTFSAGFQFQGVGFLIPIPDDTIVEPPEGYVLILEVVGPLDPRDVGRIDSTTNVTLVTIQDNDLNITVTPPTTPPTPSPTPSLPPVGLECLQALDTFVTLFSCRTLTELVSIMCSFDGVPEPNCTLGVTINFLDFSPGPHNYTLNVVDVNGQTDQFVYEFTGQVAPRIQLNLGQNVSSALEGGELFVAVNKQGLSFGDVTVRIVPLTYDQFEARGFDLDNIFPTRPAPASVDDISTAVNNNTFSAGFQFQGVGFLIPIPDDTIVEPPEGYVYILEVVGPLDPRDVGRIDSTTNVTLVTIQDNDLNVTVTPPTTPPTPSPTPSLPPVGLECLQALDTFVTLFSCRTLTELVSIMCSFDGVPAPNCTLGVTINFLDFSPGPHNYTLNVVDVNGQTDQFVYEFTGQVAPRIQLNLGQNVSSALEGGELFVFVNKQGLSFGDVTVRIVPLTYDQFEARGFDLDNIFPTRPAPASVDDISTAVNNNTFSAGFQFDGVGFLIPFPDDTIVEPPEGYVYILEVVGPLDPRDVGRIDSTTNVTLVTIQDNDDLLPPLIFECTVAIINPSADINVPCFASNNITRSVCRYDDQPPEPCNLNFVIELDRFAPGVHIVNITVTDVFGQVASRTIPFTVPPPLEFTCSLDVVPPGSPPSINCTASNDLFTIPFCEYDGGAISVPCSLAFIVDVQLSIGSHNVTISITDVFEQRASATVQFEIIQVIPPLTLDCGFAAVSGISDINVLCFTLSNITDSVCQYDDQPPEPCNLNFVIERDQFAPGGHNVTITVTDVFGQSASQTIPFTVPPTLDLTCSLDVVPPGSPPSITCTASNDLFQIPFCEYDGGAISVQCSLAFTVDVPLSFGSHSVTISIIDVFEQTASATVQFEIIEIVVPPLNLMCTSRPPVGDTFNTSVDCTTGTRVVNTTCSYDEAPAQTCTLPQNINLLDFTPEPHTLNITVVDVFGQRGSFVYRFTGVVLPRIRIRLEPREVDISEDGMGTLNFNKTGFSFGSIPFRVLPLTYNESIARGFDLDSIYPMRPIPAEAGSDFDITVFNFMFVGGGAPESILASFPVIDDTIPELTEGLLCYLEVVEGQLDPRDVGRIDFFNQLTLVRIQDNDSPVSCGSTVEENAAIIDCTGIDELPTGSNVSCSIDGEPTECTFPFSIDVSQFPGGQPQHEVRVLSQSPGETQAQVGGTQFVVPELSLSFINNTPRVNMSTVTAQFVANRPGVEIMCHFPRLDNTRENCNSGFFIRTDLPTGDHVLRVVARDLVRNERAAIRNRIRVREVSTFCVVVAANEGLTVGRNNNATVEFTSTGLPTGFQCIMDRQEPYFDCESPVMLTNLIVGAHHFKIIPEGCGRLYRAISFTFTVN